MKITFEYGFINEAPRRGSFGSVSAARRAAVGLLASPRLRFLSVSSDDNTLNISYSNFNN